MSEYAYRDVAEPLLERHDHDGDGAWDEENTWTYDQLGNVLRIEERDEDGETVTEYGYECW